MGRPCRIEYEGGLYHIPDRESEGNEIYYDDQDRLSLLEAIGEMAQRYDIHATSIATHSEQESFIGFPIIF